MRLCPPKHARSTTEVTHAASRAPEWSARSSRTWRDSDGRTLQHRSCQRSTGATAESGLCWGRSCTRRVCAAVGGPRRCHASRAAARRRARRRCSRTASCSQRRPRREPKRLRSACPPGLLRTGPHGRRASGRLTHSLRLGVWTRQYRQGHYSWPCSHCRRRAAAEGFDVASQCLRQRCRSTFSGLVTQ